MHETSDFIYSIITFSYTKYFVHSYTEDLVCTLSYWHIVVQVWYLFPNELNGDIHERVYDYMVATSLRSWVFIDKLMYTTPHLQSVSTQLS